MIKLTDHKIRKKHYLFLRIRETNKRLKRACAELDALIETKGENKKADQKLIKRQEIVNKFREQLFNEFKLFMRDKNAIPMPPEEIMYAVNRERIKK